MDPSLASLRGAERRLVAGSSESATPMGGAGAVPTPGLLSSESPSLPTTALPVFSQVVSQGG